MPCAVLKVKARGSLLFSLMQNCVHILLTDFIKHLGKVWPGAPNTWMDSGKLASRNRARQDFWSTKRREILTNLIIFKSCGEFLFQKVASVREERFLREGSSENASRADFCPTNI